MEKEEALLKFLTAHSWKQRLGQQRLLFANHIELANCEPRLMLFGFFRTSVIW